MNPHWWEHKGTYPFRAPIRVDFDSLPEMVAVYGPNEQGKTTFLDLIIAAVRLRMPYRQGSLASHFFEPGYIRMGWTAPDGEELVSSVMVDPSIGKSGKTEATLHDARGTKIAGPLQADFLKAIERRLGTLELQLTSAYAVQDSRANPRSAWSFLTAEKSDRRRVLSEILTLGKYKMIEAGANDKIIALDKELAGTRELIRRLEAEVSGLPAALERQTQHQRVILACQDAFQSAQNALGAALEAKQADALREGQIDALRRQRDALEIPCANLRNLMADVQARIDNNRLIVSRREKILADWARSTDIDASIASLTSQIETALSEDQQNFEKTSLAEAASRQRDDAITLARLKVDQHMAIRAQALAVANAEKSAAIEAKSHTLDVLTTTLTRDEHAASLLDTVPCKGQPEFQGCQFLVNAVVAKTRLNGYHVDRNTIQREIDDLRLSPITIEPQIEADFVDAVRAYEHAKAAPEVSVPTYESKAHALIEARDALRREQGLLGDAKYKSALDVAEARIVELQRELDRLTGELTEKLNSLAAINEEIGVVHAQRVSASQLHQEEIAAEKALDLATANLAEAQRQDGRLSTEITQLRSQQATLSAAQESIAPLSTQLEVWTLISMGTSPTGIPALRVDAALPQIDEYATMLLRECYGSMLYELKLATQKESKDGTKMLDTIEPLIRRGDKWEQVQVMASGGAASIISEVIALGIGLYQSEATKIRYGLLMRDEVAAPLDSSRGPRYVNMLRRALEKGGYTRALFVSHDPVAIQMADARLLVKGGTVTVE